MNEVEKMYENANVEREFAYLECHRGRSSICCPIEEYEKDDECMGCINSSAMKKVYEYPLFTAEKQIELIKWLGKLDGKLEITCTYNKEKFIFNFYFNRKTDKNHDPKYPYSNFLNEDIEILIASLINNLWQDLTEEERKQIKEILE